MCQNVSSWQTQRKTKKKNPQLKPLQGVVVRIKEILRQRVHIKRNISGKLLSNALFDMWFSLYALLQKEGKNTFVSSR